MTKSSPPEKERVNPFFTRISEKKRKGYTKKSQRELQAQFPSKEMGISGCPPDDGL
jgi:trans-aconitate methyltransferase